MRHIIFHTLLHGEITVAKKQSGDKASTLASKILSGQKKASSADSKKLAASVLSQDEKKGKREKPSGK